MSSLRERLPWRAGLYLLLAVGLTWPAVVELGTGVPGGQRTDLWDALWSDWFVHQALSRGELPGFTLLLDPPRGGSLQVADPLGALLTWPLQALLGLPAAYSLIVLFHLALAGWSAHRFAAALARTLDLPPERAGLIAGVAYGSAPILRAAVHNGSSEGIGGGLAMLAAWACWSAARQGGALRVGLAGLALFLAALGSWYGAVCAFLFAGALLLLGSGGPWRLRWGARASSLMLGVALVVPVAVVTRTAASAPDNLVRIKHPRELQIVRRSTGPADLRGFFLPGDFRSPDFREISRYGEDFFHCHYLGWVLLVGAGLGLRRRPGTGFLWLAGGAGFLLALGPVAVKDGGALIIWEDRAIPLPYLLVERLPGFSSLSLLYRLTQAPAMALSLLAGLGLAGLRRGPWVSAASVAAILVEGRLLCPLGSLPDLVDVQPPAPIRALASEPEGIVLNYPVVGGRPYLYEQTVHGHPVAGTLNFPNNGVGMRAWQALGDAAAKAGADPDPAALAAFRAAVLPRARALGVRYVIVHEDPWARPDVQDQAVQVIESAFQPLAADGPGTSAPVRVYRLW